jgi:hypothetical protein
MYLHKHIESQEGSIRDKELCNEARTNEKEKKEIKPGR